MADTAGLTQALSRLIVDPQLTRKMGDLALAHAQHQGETLDRALTLLEPLLPA